MPKRQRTDGLTERERVFVEAYVNNGGNATRAYVAAGGAPSDAAAYAGGPESAATMGWRMLRKIEVRAAVEKRRQERFKHLQMEGDEALALIALRARADLADAYDDKGRLLPFHQWPESLRLACRVRCDRDGNLEWQMPDGLKAAELMAIATGKLKTNTMQIVFNHAEYLAGLDHPPDEKEKT